MRVSFAGGGTDLPPFVAGVGGRVVGSAVDLRVQVAVEPFDRGWVLLEASALGRTLTRRTGEPAQDDPAFRLLEAALAGAGIEDGVRIGVQTEVIPGAGLGGSAAAAVAALCALRASVADPPERAELARQATRIERDGLGLVCGSQDQVFAAFGGLMDLTFDDRGCRTRSRLAAAPSLLEAFGGGLLLVDSLVRRVSGDVLRRLDTRVTHETTLELVAAAGDVVRGFREGSLDGVLDGMQRSAMAKLHRDPVANTIAVELADRLRGVGARVIRMCGAGAGGHVLVWASPEQHAAIRHAVAPYRVRQPPLAAQGVRLEAA